MTTDPDHDVPAALLGQRIAAASSPRTYVLGPLLGAGTQALVLAAEAQPSAIAPLPGPVAVKVFRPSFLRAFGAHAELIAQKELFALGRILPSPHVVRLFDRGALQLAGLAVPWLALERVASRSLKDVVEQERRLSAPGLEPRRALRVLGHAAEGLRLLHEEGVVHRDVKPSNILVSGAPPEEHARIADLGVSRPYGFGATFGVGAELGSPAYAAPELATPSRAGPLADVFSFAAVVYFALSGEPMFTGSPLIIAALKAKEAHPPLASRKAVHPAFAASGALGAISDVITRATRRDPDARPPGMRALWAELGGAIAGAVRYTQGGGPASSFARAHAPTMPAAAPASARPDRVTLALPPDDDEP